MRLGHGRHPKRIVIDRRIELNKNLNIFDQSIDTLVFNEIKTDIDGKVKYIALEDFDRYVPQYILYQLYLQDIQSVIIEGGAHTLNSFIEAGLWDEARIFTGPDDLEKGIRSPEINGITEGEFFIGNDKLLILLSR